MIKQKLTYVGLASAKYCHERDGATLSLAHAYATASGIDPMKVQVSVEYDYDKKGKLVIHLRAKERR